MAGKLKPTKYRVDGCSGACSLNPRNLPAGAYDAIHAWYEQGSNNEVIAGNAKAMNWSVSERAIARHRANHLVREDQYTPLDPRGQQVVLDPNQPAKKVSDLDILDKIIAAGAKQLDGHSVRISPEMTMKAMELRLKLTQGSVFDDFMAAVSAAFGAEEAAPSDAPEDPTALAEAMEQAQGAVPDDPAEG